jgi:HlyD family secretion protein
MTLSRKLIIAGAALLMAVFAAWFLFRPAPDAAPRYVFANVEEGPITASVSTSGSLKAAGQVTVGSQLSGQISEVLVDFNSLVVKGQVLARIDPKTFDARVRQSAAQLQVARARVAETEAMQRRAEVSLADTRSDFARRKALARNGNLSERDFESAQTKLTMAEVDVQSAAAQVLNSKAAVMQQEAALNQAQFDLDRTVIRAPDQGVVIAREIEPGQTVQASMTAPTLFVLAASLDEMEVEARVDEADIGKVRQGQQVRFSVDAFPGQIFPGSVKQIRKSPKETQNVITYTVIISARNPDQKLLPGLTAKLAIIIGEKDNVLKVPSQALRFRPREAGPREGGPREAGGRPAAQAAGAASNLSAAPGPGSVSPPGTRPPNDPDKGTVWKAGPDGKPLPIRVRVGLADQDWVEVEPLDKTTLNVGDPVIIRAERSGTTSGSGTRPPGGPPGMRF